jgi:thiol-disulfide isomerase/thioredoxin
MLRLPFVLLLACHAPPVDAPTRGEVPDSVAVNAQPEREAADAASAPSVKRPFCDRTFEKNKAKKLAWPPPGVEPKPALPRHGPMWINFWAAWCKPCREEIPTLQKWAKAWDVQLAFISLDDDDRQWRDGANALGLFALESPLTQGLVHTAAGTAWAKEAGSGEVLPAHAIVDGDGRLRCTRSGAIEDVDPDNLHAYIDALR